jgi:thermostable 8-oxoguanine DNA glycosylase
MEELKKCIEQRMGKIKENFDNPHQQPEYKQLLFCLLTINDFVEQQGLYRFKKETSKPHQ